MIAREGDGERAALRIHVDRASLSRSAGSSALRVRLGHSTASLGTIWSDEE